MSAIDLRGLGSTYRANPVQTQRGVNGAGDVVALGAIALVVGVGAGLIFGLWKLMEAANPG